MPTKVSANDYVNKIINLGLCPFGSGQVDKIKSFCDTYHDEEPSSINIQIGNNIIVILSLNDSWYALHTTIPSLFLIADEFEEVINYLKKLKDEN